MTITINCYGQGYIGKQLASHIPEARIKVVPTSPRSFVIRFSHQKLNSVYRNLRGTYVYCTKNLIPGKYIVNNELEGCHTIR